MFYSNQILARKGPLGLVWIAAHLDRQLKRQQINSTSIPASVDTLLDSEVPLALRLSGQLLLGVVRIYARKVNYLQQDCNDALVKIRVALRPADSVNLPPGSLIAPVEAITLLGSKHAAAAKASRAAGRKAAAAAAAGAKSADASAFEFDDDDIYWEQDVLLGGDGAGGFNMFELQRGTFELGLAAPSGSGPMSQDISGVFGMHSSQDFQEEFFNAEDEEAAAAWDLDELEVERLRAVASSQQQQLSSGVSGLLGLGDGATPGVEGPRGKASPAGSEYDDEQMQPPPEDLPDEPPASPDVTGSARAAAAGRAGDATPMSTWAGDGSFAAAAAAAGDVLPPTPRGTAGGSQGAEEGFAGYTGGTAAGYTPGSTGGRGAGVQGLLPPTPSMSAGGDAAAAGAGADGEVEQQEQQDADMMDVEQAGGEDAEQQQGKQVKTFQRHTRQQQQEVDNEAQQAAAAAAAAGGSSDAQQQAAAAAKPKAAAKQKRGAAAMLLGQKRRMVIDRHPEEDAAAAAADGAAAVNGSAGKRAGRGAAGRKQPPTELPTAEIRALLADRTPLLDQTRLQSQGKRLRLEAALIRAGLSGSMSLAFRGAAAAAAPGAAAAAAGGLQLQLTLTGAAAGSGSRGSGNISSNAALAALLGGPSSTGVAGNSSGAVGSLGAGSLLGYGGSLAGGLGVVGGLGLRLPLELQQMFLQAAAAGAAAAPGGGAGAVAPVAAPDEIGMVGEDELEFAGPGGAAGAGLTGRLSGATRSSLSLSLSTPGSTAAAGAGVHCTPATVAGQEPAAAVVGSAGFGTGLGSAGFGSAGFDGYTPGSLCGTAGEVPDGVLQPLDAAGVAAASQQQQQQGLVLTGGMLDDDVGHHEDAHMFGAELNGEDEREAHQEDSDKENPPPPGSAGKGAAGAAASAAVVRGGAAGVFGSSLASTQEGMLPWPADAETLQEQEEEDGRMPADGGFTSRTRLVMRHLQHAAAAAAPGPSAAAAAGMGTPATGSKRRISAVPPPGLAAAVEGKKAGAHAGAAGSAGAVSLSFQGLTQGHGRLDACRWFYEMLVLGNKGLVGLQQQEAYGDVLITPNLAAMART